MSTSYVGDNGYTIPQALLALSDAIATKQNILTFDTTPTTGSTNPATSGGIYSALALKQDNLTFDTTPTSGSTKPCTSGGIYSALGHKEDSLTFDSSPTSGSSNPVTSNGIHSALALKQNVLTFDSTPTEGSSNPVTSTGIKSAIENATGSIHGVTNISMTLSALLFYMMDGREDKLSYFSPMLDISTGTTYYFQCHHLVDTGIDEYDIYIYSLTTDGILSNFYYLSGTLGGDSNNSVNLYTQTKSTVSPDGTVNLTGYYLG